MACRRGKCDFSYFKVERNRSWSIVFFGLGLTVASFCPTGFTLFLAAVIIVALGISMLWCCN